MMSGIFEWLPQILGWGTSAAGIYSAVKTQEMPKPPANTERKPPEEGGPTEMERERLRSRRRRGLLENIATGGGGLSGPASVGKKRLLGE
jgi:hypothetical protein